MNFEPGLAGETGFGAPYLRPRDIFDSTSLLKRPPVAGRCAVLAAEAAVAAAIRSRLSAGSQRPGPPRCSATASSARTSTTWASATPGTAPTYGNDGDDHDHGRGQGHGHEEQQPATASRSGWCGPDEGPLRGRPDWDGPCRKSRQTRATEGGLLPAGLADLLGGAHAHALPLYRVGSVGELCAEYVDEDGNIGVGLRLGLDLERSEAGISPGAVNWSALSGSNTDCSVDRQWTGDCSAAAAALVISALPPQGRQRSQEEQDEQQQREQQYNHEYDVEQQAACGNDGTTSGGDGSPGSGSRGASGAGGAGRLGSGAGGGGVGGHPASSEACSRAAVGRYGTLLMSSAGWRCTEMYDMHDSLLLSRLAALRVGGDLQKWQRPLRSGLAGARESGADGLFGEGHRHRYGMEEVAEVEEVAAMLLDTGPSSRCSFDTGGGVGSSSFGPAANRRLQQRSRMPVSCGNGDGGGSGGVGALAALLRSSFASRLRGSPVDSGATATHLQLLSSPDLLNSAVERFHPLDSSPHPQQPQGHQSQSQAQVHVRTQSQQPQQQHLPVGSRSSLGGSGAAAAAAGGGGGPGGWGATFDALREQVSSRLPYYASSSLGRTAASVLVERSGRLPGGSIRPWGGRARSRVSTTDDLVAIDTALELPPTPDGMFRHVCHAAAGVGAETTASIQTRAQRSAFPELQTSVSELQRPPSGRCSPKEEQLQPVASSSPVLRVRPNSLPAPPVLQPDTRLWHVATAAVAVATEGGSLRPVPSCLSSPRTSAASAAAGSPTAAAAADDDDDDDDWKAPSSGGDESDLLPPPDIPSAADLQACNVTTIICRRASSNRGDDDSAVDGGMGTAAVGAAARTVVPAAAGLMGAAAAGGGEGFDVGLSGGCSTRDAGGATASDSGDVYHTVSQQQLETEGAHPGCSGGKGVAAAKEMTTVWCDAPLVWPGDVVPDGGGGGGGHARLRLRRLLQALFGACGKGIGESSSSCEVGPIPRSPGDAGADESAAAVAASAAVVADPSGSRRGGSSGDLAKGHLDSNRTSAATVAATAAMQSSRPRPLSSQFYDQRCYAAAFGEESESRRARLMRIAPLAAAVLSP